MAEVDDVARALDPHFDMLNPLSKDRYRTLARALLDLRLTDASDKSVEKATRTLWDEVHDHDGSWMPPHTMMRSVAKRALLVILGEPVHG
jgi:hypothetical protein